MPDKAMFHQESGVAPPIAAVLGMLLAYMEFLPDGLFVKILTLLMTGALTGAAGLVTQRILRNLFKRFHKRRLLPSILKDESDDK